MTRRYWETTGGTLIEECLIQARGPGMAPRWADGIIITDGETRIAARDEQIDLNGRDIIIVQTKAKPLGMYLLGQAFFSRELTQKNFTPRSIRTIALCAADDAALRPIAEQWDMEVVIDAQA
jgi:hypothetical protein